MPQGYQDEDAERCIRVGVRLGEREGTRRWLMVNAHVPGRSTEAGGAKVRIAMKDEASDMGISGRGKRHGTWNRSADLRRR